MGFQIARNVLVPTVILLAVPLVTIAFIGQPDWNLFDFVVMGVLIAAAAFGIEIVRQTVPKKYRMPLIVLVLCGLFLLFAELSVGIFNTPFAGS